MDRSVGACETEAMSPALAVLPGSSPGAFDTGVTLAGFVIGVIVVAMVVLIVVKVVSARRRGINPLTFDAELAAKLRDSSVLQPEKSVEARLAEIDDLHARGVITDAERESARASVLRG
ncbi:competence protein ComGC [Frigoribacterium sp. PvP120]